MELPPDINMQDCDIAFHLPNPINEDQLVVRMSLKDFCNRLVETHPSMFIGPRSLWDAIGTVLLNDVGECNPKHVEFRIKSATFASEFARRLTDLRVIMGSMGCDNDLLNTLLRAVAVRGIPKDD